VSRFPAFAIRELASENARPRCEERTTRVWLLNLDQIESDSGRILEKQFVDPRDLGSSTHPFDKGTVLYSKLRPYLNKVVVANSAGFASTELVPIRCNRDHVLPEYLAYFLRSPYFVSFSTAVVAGAKMPRMVMSEFWKYKIPLPPMPEQRRIAAILDKADALRAKRHEALTYLDRLARLTFNHMFGDPIRNEERWRTRCMKDISSRIQIGPFGSQVHEADYVKGGVPLVNPMHIRDGAICPDHSYTINEEKHNQLKQYHLAAGDLIIGRRGEMGRCAVVSSKERGWLCGTGSLFLRPKADEIHPHYLAHVIASHGMRRHLENAAQGATMANLNKDLVGGLVIPVPPMDKQEQFVASLDAVNALKSLHRSHFVHADSLFASLQHRAFQGDL
jgi:type I restriction enzyme, S subunit